MTETQVGKYLNNGCEYWLVSRLDESGKLKDIMIKHVWIRVIIIRPMLFVPQGLPLPKIVFLAISLNIQENILWNGFRVRCPGQKDENYENQQTPGHFEKFESKRRLCRYLPE